MLVCRRSGNGFERWQARTAQRVDSPGNGKPRFGFGGGGPVFLPRRKPSAIARALLAEIAASDSRPGRDDGIRPATG